MFELILASTSPWRRRMLESAGFDVRCVPPEIDESLALAADPCDRAARLARQKARAVADRLPGAWVLGADQVAWDGAEVFGKPRDAADHLARLRSLRGRSHDLVTAFAIVHPDGEDAGLETTRLWMRADLGDDELAAYVAGGEGTGCAGGYAAEGRGAWLFSRIEGDWNNVLGLPLFAVIAALRARGWRMPGPPA